MKKFLFAAILAAMLTVPTFAQAEDVDMAKLPCKEFLNAGKDMGLLLTWIDGYMSAKSDNTMMSDAWMEKLGKHMGEYCSKNPNHTIMQAMEKVPE